VLRLQQLMPAFNRGRGGSMTGQSMWDFLSEM
jgi:hypothetical protein